MPRDEELAMMESFARTNGVVRCPSEREVAMSEAVPLILKSRTRARGHGGLVRYRPPFDAPRVRDEDPANYQAGLMIEYTDRDPGGKPS